MSDISTAFKNHLDQSVTTLCKAWQLTLADGTDIGFTDHDETLLIDGKSYAPNRSLNASDRDHRLGFEADGGAFQSVFDVPELSSENVRTGQLDDATLTEYLVNWQDPSQYAIIASGRIGRVKVLGQGFEAEWLGHATKLNRNIGRLFSKQCDASFGDTRCGVNLETYPEGTTCPRTFEACASQFNNTINYRGFPYLLGDDALQVAPQIGELRDGSSRYR